MLKLLVYLQLRNAKKSKKLVKIVNVDDILINLRNNLRNVNEIFRKNVSYDNIKSRQNPGLYPLSRKSSFGKTTG